MTTNILDFLQNAYENARDIKADNKRAKEREKEERDKKERKK